MSITSHETTTKATQIPSLGDEVRVETLPGLGVITGIWLGLTNPADGFDRASVEAIVLTQAGDVWTGWAPPSGLSVIASNGKPPASVTPPTALGALLNEIRSHRATQQEVITTQQQFAQRMDTLIRDAHEWADDNDLCTVFDDFCESHDLPSRSREYRFRVTFTGYAYVTATAHTEDDARAEISAQDVLDELDSNDLTLDDIDLN